MLVKFKECFEFEFGNDYFKELVGIKVYHHIGSPHFANFGIYFAKGFVLEKAVGLRNVQRYLIH